MRPSFQPRLVNSPFEDPGVFISFAFQKRAILFDLGDIHCLSTRDIIKVEQIFISHTHIDHFIGFDHLLRILLGRDKELQIFGPPGLHKQVQGKLAGYTWNLVDNYTNRFIIRVTEIHPDHLRTQSYACHEGFTESARVKITPFKGIVYQEPLYTIHAAFFNHEIPCLGYALHENFHVNIKKDALVQLDLPVGPWINTFKQLIYEGFETDTIITIPSGSEARGLNYTVADLLPKIALVTPGQKVAYLTDMIYDEATFEKLNRLAVNADLLFIEAAFLDRDKEAASKKYHLTAHQSGKIAGYLKVKKYILFHHSPKYLEMKTEIEKEARAAFLTFLDSGKIINGDPANAT